MKIIQINLALPQIIDFAPTNVVLEVGQNIYNLLSTAKYSVPLNRDFGLSTTYIDQPINIMKARLRAEIIEAIAKYEPRFTVQSIDFTTNKAKEGALYPIIRGVINET